MDTPPFVRRTPGTRHEPTDAEAALWRLLRARSLAGFKFRRQYPAGPFILDFFCLARGVSQIELDGGQHYQPDTQTYDDWRSRHLIARHIRVLRFPNDVVLREPDSVVAAIAGALGVRA